MKVAKGKQDRAKEQILGLKSILDRIILENKDNFDISVENNLKNISAYLEKAAPDLFKEDIVKKYYSGEKSYKEIPINVLTTIRFSGDDNLVAKLDTRTPYLSLNKVIELPTISNLKDVRITSKAPKYVGYSDGIMFHILKSKNYRNIGALGMIKDYFLMHLQNNNIPYYSEDTIYESFPPPCILTSICREVGVIPLYRIDSWCPKVDLSHESYSIYRKFVNKNKKDI